MLFKRDYTTLTKDEQLKLQKAENFYSKFKTKDIDILNLSIYHEMIPKSAYNYKSLFPNNYLRSGYDMSYLTLKKCLRDLAILLESSNCNEREILNFINDNEYYFVLDALFDYYDFGHHDAYLFKEFALPPNYQVDYLLVGKNSSGYQFVFIEFEHPNNEITLSDGSLGRAYRKGLKQLEDWEEWIDANFHNLKNVFKKYQSSSKLLPLEFYEYDKTRVHYMLIAGQRKHFNEKTYRLKRKGINNFKILHYNNLLDLTEIYIQRKIRDNNSTLL